ncbi:MAG: hypothetical protein IPJ19_12845 [Planctomycetes bacterium]|nr:hypothetical protein [Planctomycetota bacterium]
MADANADCWAQLGLAASSMQLHERAEQLSRRAKQAQAHPGPGTTRLPRTTPEPDTRIVARVRAYFATDALPGVEASLVGLLCYIDHFEHTFPTLAELQLVLAEPGALHAVRMGSRIVFRVEGPTLELTPEDLAQAHEQQRREVAATLAQMFKREG